MAQTFLQLTNTLAREAGVTGTASSVTTVVGQTGEANRLVNWIRQAHNEIQNKHAERWRWLRSTFSVNTVASTGTYAYSACTDTISSSTISRFNNWIPFDDRGASNIKRYLTSGGVSGETWMVFIPWAYYMSIYRRGTQNDGPIIHVSIDPQNNLVLGPKPDAVYTVSGEYQKSQLNFTADADVPELPVQYQDVIWLLALEKYGRFHVAPEVVARGQIEGGRLLRQLEKNQLPELTLGQPIT